MPESPFSSAPYDNLLKIGSKATELNAHGEAKGWDKVFANRKLKALRVYALNQAQAARLGELKALEALVIFNGLANDLSSLTELPKLRELNLESLGHIRDFSFLGGLKKVRTLKISDVSRFKDAGMLEKLSALRTLDISLVFSSVKFPTLKSFAKLKQLEVLHLGLDVEDGSLAPLTGLTGLKELGLPFFFELKEYARLAVALPRVKCSALTNPYGPASVFFKCRRCKGTKGIILARGHRSLCPTCDAEKFQAYLKSFENMKAGFRRKAGH